MVERLLHTNTNLVLRESLDVSLHHLLPWYIELVIDDPEPEHTHERERDRETDRKKERKGERTRNRETLLTRVF